MQVYDKCGYLCVFDVFLMFLNLGDIDIVMKYKSAFVFKINSDVIVLMFLCICMIK